MIINQNFNAYGKLSSPVAISNLAGFIKFCSLKISRACMLYRIAFGFLLLVTSTESMMAAPRDSQNNDEASKPQQVDSTISKQSSEPSGVNMDDNIRLRRTLDEYSRTVDPAHVQIEERRRVMHNRLQERFSQTDKDNDGTISLEEAYDSMPQLARHFGAVDLNGDRLITLDELEALQARIYERQRIVSVKTDAGEADNSKTKSKQSVVNNRKNAL
jgi:hypothetical protein